jgi:prevent-host-death family protein
MEGVMKDTIPVSVAEAKARLSEKIRACGALNRVFLITSHGKPRAVLMSYEAYTAMAGEERTPVTIDAKAWTATCASQKEVAGDLKNLFDEKGLSRKGQKGYKQRTVKRMEGS